jgi:hypothetical protein
MTSTTLKRIAVALVLAAFVALAAPPGLAAAPRLGHGAVAATAAADSGIWTGFVHGLRQALEALGLPFGPAARRGDGSRSPAAAHHRLSTLAGKMGADYDPNG